MTTTASAVVGGTASVLGGGQFANGAKTAAFGYLFNQLASKTRLGCTASNYMNCAMGDRDSDEWKESDRKLKAGVAAIADKSSTGLAMASAVPNPLSPELAVSAIGLKGLATMLNPPTRNEVIYDSLTV